MSLRVVYDTNVIVSGTLVPSSIPASLISLALQRVVQLTLSPALVDEYREVLLRPKFGFQSNSVNTFLSDLQKTAIIVHPTEKVSVSPDEADNRFLECALTARAEHLVTGNIKHFPVDDYKGIKIVSPADFAAILIE